MSRWFRFYSEALEDPKVQNLSGDDFKLWVNLLCLANRNSGFLPAMPDIAFALRINENGAITLVERLLNATLIDRVNGGVNGYRYAPHGWDERQYKSDTSTDRVKRFRERSKPVTETPPETEAEAETDTEKKEEQGGGKPPSYAFFGQTIRLKPFDLNKWRTAFHAIPDFEAELISLDAWFQTQPEAKRKSWFHVTAGSLNRKHQELMAIRNEAAQGAVWDGMP